MDINNEELWTIKINKEIVVPKELREGINKALEEKVYGYESWDQYKEDFIENFIQSTLIQDLDGFIKDINEDWWRKLGD